MQQNHQYEKTVELCRSYAQSNWRDEAVPKLIMDRITKQLQHERLKQTFTPDQAFITLFSCFELEYHNDELFQLIRSNVLFSIPSYDPSSFLSLLSSVSLSVSVFPSLGYSSSLYDSICVAAERFWFKKSKRFVTKKSNVQNHLIRPIQQLQKLANFNKQHIQIQKIIQKLQKTLMKFTLHKTNTNTQNKQKSEQHI